MFKIILKKYRLALTSIVFVLPLFSLGQNTNNVDTTNVNKVVERVAVRPAVDGVFNSPGGKKSHIYKRTPVPYVSFREADGMWQKTIWRFIDVREKINLPFYYPTQPIGDRISLCDILKYGTRIDTGLYNYRKASLRSLYGDEEVLPSTLAAYTTPFCDYPYTTEEINRKFGYTKKMPVFFEDGTLNPDSTTKTIEPLGSIDIIGYEIKEVWFFDKQRSVLDKRIIAIRPVFEYEKEVINAIVPTNADGTPATPPVDAEDEEGDKEVQLGPWFYFPELRNYLACADVYNKENENESKSFDDIFLKRRFSGVVKAEGNDLDNRTIQSYIMYGLDQVLESERIKDKIRTYEHDVWEF